MLKEQDGKLIFHYDAEKLWIEPWGPNALRIWATKEAQMSPENWALTFRGEDSAKISAIEQGGEIVNGKIRATVSRLGKLMVYNSDGKLLLEEYSRNRRDVLDPKCSAIEVEAREFKPIPGGDYHLTMRFESLDSDEKIFGMGQYQQPHLNLKGLDLELAHRNSQASVPFALSSLGYSLLWNNPGVGRAVLGKNIMSFEAYSTRALDYWIVAGDTPAEIEEAYASVTGTVPMMPEYGLGFWQCKLRYQTQEELLEVAREYKRRGLPIDLIVIDFFHWPKQGEWKFDPVYWPDPDGMVRELKDMGIELGSTCIKAVAIDARQAPVSSGDCTWASSYKNGVWTYALDEVWKGLKAALSGVKDRENVCAMGVSAMMHGYLAFDADWNLLTPFRTWQNTITGPAAAELTELFGAAPDTGELYTRLYNKSLEGETDCGGVTVCNYLSDKGVTHVDVGRPLVVRTPESRFTLANFVRAQLYSAMTTLKIGMDILAREGVTIDSLTGHGGLFKTPLVGQKYLAAACGAPVTCMDTAGEGGPCGTALLAAYRMWKADGETLEDYLAHRVFAGVSGSTVQPDRETVDGFNAYLERYKALLDVERKAMEVL